MTDHISPANGISVDRSKTGGRARVVAAVLSLVGLLIAGPSAPGPSATAS